MTVAATTLAQARTGFGDARARMRVKLDPLRLYLFLLTIITVSRVHQHWEIIGKFRPALLLAVFTAIYAFLNPKQIRPENFQYWPPRVIAALAVWACLSVPFGISMGGSAVYILFVYSKTLIYAFLLVLAIRGVRDLYAFVWAYVISSAILVYFSLFVFGLSRAAGSYAERLNDLYTFDANDVGLVLMIGLPLTMLAFQTAKGLPKLFCGVLLAGLGATISRTGSRGAFVGFIITGTALLVLLKNVSIVKRMAFVAVTVAALVIWAPPGYWEQMNTLTNPTQDYNWTTADGRKEVSKRGIGYMLHYPIFGLGINNFWRAECFISDKAVNHVAGTGLRCTPPHNSYLQAGAELGIPGLILWVTLVWGCIVTGLKLRKRLPMRWLHGDPEQRFLYLASMYIPVAMIGFATTSVFLTFAWMDMVYIVAALTTGLILAAEQKLRAEQNGGTPAAVAAAAPRRRWRGAPIEPKFLTAPPPQ
jgi:O-antigen ligase